MAKLKSTDGVGRKERIKRKRPGVHSKKKNSKLKNSINYKKRYVGQG